MATLTKELPPLDFEELLSCVVNRLPPDQGQTNPHKSSRIFANEFQAPVVTDLTSPDAVCDWCGQTAERRFTALGGSLHNTTGVFCSPCGQLFMEKVVNS